MPLLFLISAQSASARQRGYHGQARSILLKLDRNAHNEYLSSSFEFAHISAILFVELATASLFIVCLFRLGCYPSTVRRKAYGSFSPRSHHFAEAGGRQCNNVASASFCSMGSFRGPPTQQTNMNDGSKPIVLLCNMHTVSRYRQGQ